MANRRFTQFFETLHNKPVLLDCNFIVDSANGNGFGVRSLKGPGIANVYMHTSSTPASGNPNPIAGMIMVKLQDSYNGYFGGFSGQVSPLDTGTATIVAGHSYVIEALGTTTSAQWQAAGVPLSACAMGLNGLPGLPAVGTAFVAITGETIPGSPTVAPPLVSGIDHIEVVGDPNSTVASNQAGGGYLILQCLNEGALAAPADGTVISLSLYLSNTRIQNKGE